MHRVPLIVLAAGLSAGCRERADPPSAARDDARMRDEVTAFEREWAAAATARTRGKLDSLMADEWTITLSDGRRSDKRRALVRWAAPASGGVLRDTSIVDSVEVRALSPDAAVAVAALTDVELYASRAETTRTHVTDVVVRRAGRWQAVVSHESEIPRPAAQTTNP